jgi:hypothetical protein
MSCVLRSPRRSHTASSFALSRSIVRLLLFPGLRGTRPVGAEFIHSNKSHAAFSIFLAQYAPILSITFPAKVLSAKALSVAESMLQAYKLQMRASHNRMPDVALGVTPSHPCIYSHGKLGAGFIVPLRPPC